MHEIGSIWSKWDLHVHTPESFQHDYRFDSQEEADSYGNDIWEKYIAEIERLTDITAIGITDYYSLDGYRKILFYRDKGRLGNIPLFLPNIEFRLDKFLSGDANKKLNFHVIFDENVPIEIIETEFLNSLTFKTHLGEDRSLNRNNIEDVGKLLKRDHEKFRGSSDYFIGCMNVSISFESIVNILEKKKSLFGGNYLFVLPEERWSDIGWDGQDHLTRKQLFIQCHTLFSSNENTREWALGYKEVSKERFIQEFCTLKPCIHGSDAHNFDRLCKPDENKYCWIKADPTFEGLKQICYEPESRVRIQEISPDPRKNIYSLESLKISNSKVSSELCIREQELPLNNSLVAIIGGKGSGKTAALDLIANCFEDRRKRNLIDHNSFIQRIEDQKPDFTVAVSFINKENFTKVITEENFFTSSQITYLPQGRIEEFSSDKIKLHNKITEIINSSHDVIESGYLQQIQDCQVEIENLNKSISDCNRAIIELELETTKEIEEQKISIKKLKEGNLRNKTDELDNLTGSIGKDSTEKVKTLKNIEADFIEKYSNFRSIENCLIEIQSKIDDVAQLNNDIEKLNTLIKGAGITVSVPLFDIQSQEKETIVINAIIHICLKEYSERSSFAHDKLSMLSGFEKSHANLLKEIADINDEIASLENDLNIIVEKKQKCERIKSDRLSYYANLLVYHFQLQDIYNKIIQTFSSGKDEILENIDFKSSIEFDQTKFVNIGEKIFDLRKISVKEIRRISDYLLHIINGLPHNARLIKIFLSKGLSLVRFLKNTYNNNDLYNWVFGNYFGLGTEIIFNGIQMDKLSIGQKGTVLLKILLAESDHPLIIDQPEENLDNKFVYEFLVEAFTKAKNRRQIIVATHNANLVVNTDAEQIIVAEFLDNEISYSSGSIENQIIKNSITTLLEGGEEAFKKREAKYGYSI